MNELRSVVLCNTRWRKTFYATPGSGKRGKGIDLAAAERPALIVLDLGLPDISGLQVCIEIRKWSVAPILVLSARHSDQEKVALLDAGADDYVTKPFSTSELKARVRALLRRSTTRESNGATTILCGDQRWTRCPHTNAQWCAGSPR
jgi:DNA-binding response OmpR family regulator